MGDNHSPFLIRTHESGSNNQISRLPRFVYREFDFRSQRGWEQ